MDTASAAPSAPSPSQGSSAPAQGGQTEAKGTVGNQTTSPSTTTAQEMYELKVNGQTKRLSREDLIKQAQLGYSANERFEQSSQQKKQVESIIGRFKSNPIEALMDPALGLSKDQVRTAMEAWYTKEFIEPERMTPEQLELRNAREKLSQYEKQEQAKLKEAADKEFEALTHRERETVQTQITTALDKSGLPKTKFIVARMAFYMHKNLANGWDAPMEVIIDQVKSERQSMLSDLTDSSDAEALISYLGEGFVNKIRKHDLARLRQRKQGGVSEDNRMNPQSKSSRTEDEKSSISYRDVNKNLRRLMQGK